MRILGKEPTFISDPSPTKSGFKSGEYWPEGAKQAEAKSDGVINPHNYKINQFYTDNLEALKTLRINWIQP